MSSPGRVVLDDLATPRFAPEIDQLRAGLADIAPSYVIEPDALCEAACERTGLDDFGDEAFGERLDVLCTAFRNDVELAPSGIVSVHSQLVGLLANRLLIQHELNRHPEIHDVRIERPIIICGLPRTGTTHLHNLIAADPALRALPYWEAREPVLADHERPQPGEPNPRRARTQAGLDISESAMPYFKRMHEMSADHAHEEIHLLGIDLSTMLFETMAPLPTWRDYYLSHDQTPSYEYLRTVLKVLQWSRGGTRWVLKSPQHLEQFGPLVSTFPDATFVVTHRDPVAVIVSMATMLAYGARMSFSPVDVHGIAAYWAARGEDLFSACVRDRDVLPADQSIDVRFDEFMADDVAMVERIYDVAGQPFTDETRGAMNDFMAEHPRGRHGTVAYDAEVLGIDRDDRRRALAFYSERFGVSDEAPAH